MPREKLNRGDNRDNRERDISRGDRQNVSSQRNSSMEENNKKNRSLKDSRSQTGPRGKSSIEESDRSE